MKLDLDRAAQLPLLHSSASTFYTHPASTPHPPLPTTVHPSQPLSGTHPASISTHPASTIHPLLPTTIHPNVLTTECLPWLQTSWGGRGLCWHQPTV